MVTALGITTDVKGHRRNTSSSIEVRELGMTTDVMPQLLNALAPIEVTDSLIFNTFTLLQSLKDDSPIVMTEFGISIDVSLLQPLKT